MKASGLLLCLTIEQLSEAEANQQRPLALKNLERSGLNVPDAIQVGGWRCWGVPLKWADSAAAQPMRSTSSKACLSSYPAADHTTAVSDRMLCSSRLPPPCPPPPAPPRQVPVACTEDVLEVMDRGQRNRAVAETRMNDRSSRSHQVRAGGRGLVERADDP